MKYKLENNSTVHEGVIAAQILPTIDVSSSTSCPQIQIKSSVVPEKLDDTTTYRGYRHIPDVYLIVSGHSQTLKYKEDYSFETAIYEIKLSEIKNKFSIIKRLRSLYEDSLDLEEDNLSIGSVKYFIAFLGQYPDLFEPDFSISVSGNIRSQWSISKSKHFVLEFWPDGEITFVIFTPNIMHSRKITRVSGKSDAKSIIETAKTLGVMEWAKNGQ